MQQPLEQGSAAFFGHLHQSGDVSENTLSAYRVDLQQLVDFLSTRGRRTWCAVTHEDLLAFQLDLRERRYADSTIARRTAAARMFFAYLVGQNDITANPMDGIDAPKVSYAPRRTLTVNQVDELLELPLRNPTPERRRDKAMLELLYATGVQVSELSDLDRTDVDLEARTVRCGGRSRRVRTLPLGEAAHTALEEYLDTARPQLARNAAATPALFLNHRGSRLSRQGIWLLLQGYAGELGIDGLTPRLLRTTFAAHQLHGGADLNEVQQRLGHTTNATTRHYEGLATE